MADLTQRQLQILKSIIEEYTNTAEAVGSETLEKKYNLGFSPATIRNEMVTLTDFGFLKKPHTSAGRIPTPPALKLYVKELMKEKELSVADEVSVKERLWDYREKEDQFLKELTRSLAEKTKALALAKTNEGELYFAGFANILEMPEFFDIDVTRTLLSAIDELDSFNSIFAQSLDDQDIHILLEEELGPKLRGPYGCVFTHFETPRHLKGEVGVLGPTRLNYTQIVPTVRYFRNLISEIAEGW